MSMLDKKFLTITMAGFSTDGLREFNEFIAAELKQQPANEVSATPE